MLSSAWPLLLSLTLARSPIQESAPPSLAALLREDTIFFWMVEDLSAFRTALHDTFIGRIAAEDVQEFLKQPLTALSGWWNESVGIPLEGLLDGDCRRMFVALSDVDAPVIDGEDLGLVIGWEANTPPKCLDSPTIHRASIGGIPVFSPREDALDNLRRVELDPGVTESGASRRWSPRSPHPSRRGGPG